MKFRTVLCLTLLLNTGVAGALSGQTRLTGMVLDAETDQPLPGANVTVDGTTLGAAADEHGRFAIADVPGGQRQITATFVGYVSYHGTVQAENAEARLDIRLQPTVLQGQTVIVSATRAKERETPVAFTNINRGHLERTLTAADVPAVLAETPNVHTWSNSGNSVGYTYMSIRGFPQERVAVMVNGIPQNDPQTHQVYWIDMPDLAESVEDIQVQRGVGSSLYGHSTIGGIVNLQTGTFRQQQGFSFTGMSGSYNSRKFAAEYNSGLIGNGYQMYGRFSRITSDGYRDQSWSDLWSYYFGVVKNSERSRLEINLFGGTERTHFAFFGAPKEALAVNRKANPFSAYQDASDNFTEPHYQVIHTFEPSNQVRIANRLFYKKGDGYFNDIYFDPVTFAPTNDIRQDHLDIRHYGWLPRVEFEHSHGSLSVGGEARQSWTRHWGLVLGGPTEEYSNGTSSQRLYDYVSRKMTYGFYVNELWRPVEQLGIMADLSIRGHRFAYDDDTVLQSESIEDFSYHFVMPRFGVNYNVTPEINVFGNYSMGRREPAFTDIYDAAAFFGDADRRAGFAQYDPASNTVSDPLLQSEKLNDFEFGAGYARDWISVKLNAYVMDFNDEIIATGVVGNTGAFAQRNAGESTHSGTELALTLRPVPALTFSGNATVSRNRLEAYEGADYNGNRLPNFPDRLLNARVTVQQGGFWGSLWVRHVGDYFFDIPNTPGSVVEAYTTAGLRMSWRLPDVFGARMVEPGLEINNLFNAKYDTWGALVFGTPAWIPSATRNYMVSLKVAM